MEEARILTLNDLKQQKAETIMFIETKQTLRPAIVKGVIDRGEWLKISRYAVDMMTTSKIAKYWEWRLYNKTWRLWSARPTRDQRLAVKWE